MAGTPTRNDSECSTWDHDLRCQNGKTAVPAKMAPYRLALVSELRRDVQVLGIQRTSRRQRMVIYPDGCHEVDCWTSMRRPWKSTGTDLAVHVRAGARTTAATGEASRPEVAPVGAGGVAAGGW